MAREFDGTDAHAKPGGWLGVRAGWPAVAVVVLLVAIQRRLIGFTPCDDAFITYRFARNLAIHGQLAYNLHDPVFGCTTPLYALMLAGLHWLGFPVDRAASGATLVLDVIVCLLLVRLGRLFYGSSTLGVLAVVLWLTHPVIGLNAVSGMETSLFIALLLGMILCLHAGKHGLAFVFVTLLVWTRIDGIAAAPVWLVSWWRHGRPRLRAASLLGAAGVACLYSAFIWASYRTIVPQSAVAKVTLARGSLSGAPLMAVSYIAAIGGVLSIWYWLIAPHALLLLGLGRLAIRRRLAAPAEAELILLAVCHAAVFILPGRLFATLFPWYYSPFLTLLLLPALWRLVDLVRDVRAGGRPIRAWPFAATAIGVGACGLALIAYISASRDHESSLLRSLAPAHLVASAERMERLLFALSVNVLLVCAMLLLCSAWIRAASRLSGAAGRPPWRSWLNVATSVGILVLGLIPIGLDQAHVSRKYERRERAYAAIGAWAEQNVPEGEWIGAVEIGALGYAAAGLNVFDEAGLVTTEALRESRDEYVRRLRPAMVVERSESVRGNPARRHIPAGYLRIESTYNSVLLRGDLRPKWEASPPPLSWNAPLPHGSIAAGPAGDEGGRRELKAKWVAFPPKLGCNGAASRSSRLAIPVPLCGSPSDGHERPRSH